MSSKINENMIKNAVYKSAMISSLSVVYAMGLKKVAGMSPPSVSKFSLEDVGKLVLIVAASDLTRQWLITSSILPPNI